MFTKQDKEISYESNFAIGISQITQSRRKSKEEKDSVGNNQFGWNIRKRIEL